MVLPQFRNYAEDPAPAELAEDDARREEQDYGNVVHFEHINLEVPDLEVARIFYSEVLGLTLDPSRDGAQRGGAEVLWFNIGRQQFHIVKGRSAQTLPLGSVIGLVLPEEMVNKIPHAAVVLRPVLGDMPPVLSITSPSESKLVVTDPHGITFAIHQQYMGFPYERGIAYVHLPCFMGTSPLIARFYSQTLGAPVHLHNQPIPIDKAALASRLKHGCVIHQESEATRTSATGAAAQPSASADVSRCTTPAPIGEEDGAGGAVVTPGDKSLTKGFRGVPIGVHGQPHRLPTAVVQLGPSQLVFFENPELGPWSTEGAIAQFSGWHIAFYIAQFSHCYARLRHLLYNNHRYRDKVHTFHDALDHQQFRFQDIVMLEDPFAPPTPMLEVGPPHNQLVPVTLGTTVAITNAAGSATTAGTANTADPASMASNDQVPHEAVAALVARQPGHLVPVTAVVPYRLPGGDEEGKEVEILPGQLLYRISHEVRSLAHPNFLRPLFNRPHHFM